MPERLTDARDTTFADADDQEDDQGDPRPL